MFKRNEKKMFSKPKGRKNLEFRGKEITVDIKNWNFLSEGLSTKHICKLLKKKKKIVYNFVGGGNQIGRSPSGGKGVIFFPPLQMQTR